MIDAIKLVVIYGRTESAGPQSKTYHRPYPMFRNPEPGEKVKAACRNNVGTVVSQSRAIGLGCRACFQCYPL